MKDKKSIEATICPICDCVEHKHLYTTRDRHYGIAGNYEIVKCVNCALVFLSPMPSAEELMALYPDDFYAYKSHKKRGPVKRLLRILLGMNTKEPKFRRPGCLLDLGCGSGEFMDLYRTHGWGVWGVEPSLKAAQLGREKYGLNIFGGTLPEAKLPDAYFDFIRCSHSLEHIPDPNVIFAELRRIINPAGRLHIGVPNIDSFNARLFGKYWWHLGAPVHTFSYSPKTLAALAEKHGFVPEKVQYNSDSAGIVGSIQIFLNRNGLKKSTEGRIVNSALAKLLGQLIAKLLDLFKEGDVVELTLRPKSGLS